VTGPTPLGLTAITDREIDGRVAWIVLGSWIAVFPDTIESNTASVAAAFYRSSSGRPREPWASAPQRLPGGPDNVSRLAGV